MDKKSFYKKHNRAIMQTKAEAFNTIVDIIKYNDSVISDYAMIEMIKMNIEQSLRKCSHYNEKLKTRLKTLEK